MSATAAPSQSLQACDLLHRSRQVHWPKGFDPAQAPSFAHNELQMHASCDRVWNRLISAPEWPSWFILVKDVRLPEGRKTLVDQLQLQWNILGGAVQSKITEFVPNSRLGWLSFYGATNYYHAWYLEPTAGGCTVLAEEVGIGPDAAKLAQSNDTSTHRAHDLWLASLRWASGS